jgi:TonB family protein
MVGWVGIQRKLIRRREPEFPPILSTIGQEIEGEARISVAPSGIVTRVEITKSSGYIEFDASVEAALRDYLYSRVDGRIDTVGTVHFRFRLEKQD